MRRPAALIFLLAGLALPACAAPPESSAALKEAEHFGEQPSSALAPETLYLILVNPWSGVWQYHWDGAVLVATKGPGHPSWPRGCPPVQVEISPSVDAWQKFWAELDDLDVWSWQRSYEQRFFALDASAWELEVRGRGKYVRASGYGAFPPQRHDGRRVLFWEDMYRDSPKFMRLLRAFETLAPPTGEAAKRDRCSTEM